MRRASLLLLCLLGVACGDRRPATGLDVSSALGGEAAAGFARASEPRRFAFPEDHNAHRAFRNEWWYFTGQLATADGEGFGYQVTFFRIALAPAAPGRSSAWATRQVWMAHVALSAIDAGAHWHGERFARAALGLAGQQARPFRVWLEDWQVTGGEGGSFPWELAVATEDFTLALSLSPERDPLLQGDEGLSQKSAEAGNASYYYSITRLATAGAITVGGERHTVTGRSWLDREWSTSALGADQAGWDWFSLQLDNGADLMVYRLRQKDGSTDRHSAGTLLGADGRRQALAAGDFQLQPRRWWRSEDGTRYPVAWRLQVPGAGLDLRVEALLDDQVMDTAVRYWEGAVSVAEADSDRTLGRGYLEMTGYRP
ncbi:lipocalin-like domain-containing protein [Pseudohaliea sp.]|uniref:lipocalin-like domain-containing protein n=1 Tax=Pseudohaliea sp. TaxID=2740289 RepID=UPI0032EB9A93